MLHLKIFTLIRARKQFIELNFNAINKVLFRKCKSWQNFSFSCHRSFVKKSVRENEDVSSNNTFIQFEYLFIFMLIVMCYVWNDNRDY
jgi:hypothetical protein